MKSLISITDFTVEELQELIDTANDIIADPAAYSQICRGKKLATLFFEPSTRPAGEDQGPAVKEPGFEGLGLAKRPPDR